MMALRRKQRKGNAGVRELKMVPSPFRPSVSPSNACHMKGPFLTVRVFVWLRARGDSLFDKAQRQLRVLALEMSE